MIALCPQLPEHNASISEELGLTFPVLQDRFNEVATAFGLTLPTPPAVIEAERFLGLDLPEFNGSESDSWDLPMPARYVIGDNGEIVYASVHADHRTRTEPEDCLSALEQ